MFLPGTTICPHCKQTHTIAYYRDRDRKAGLELLTTRKLFQKPTFKVVISDDDCDDEVRLAKPHPVDCDGMPDSLLVYFDVDAPPAAPTEVHRVCPNPACNSRIPSAFGKHICFTIAIVGEPAAGKSAWLSALTYPEHLSVFNNAAFPVYFDFSRVNSSGKSLDVATGIGSIGETVTFSLKDKATDEIIADILLMDAAGESFRVDSGWSNTKADAYIFMEDIHNALADDEDRPLEMAYNNLKKHGIHNKAPVVYVGTHADLLCKSDLILDKVTGTPIFTPETFPLNYSPDALPGRFLLEADILRRLGVSLVHDPGIDQAFLVKSCTSNGTNNTYRSVMNLYDPLIFLLNKLDLIPILPTK